MSLEVGVFHVIALAGTAEPWSSKALGKSALLERVSCLLFADSESALAASMSSCLRRPRLGR